jgi:hypothetical protein
VTSGRPAADDRLALDLMVVGAAKSATTSVDALLHTAPRVTANPSDAEIGYFLRDDEFARGAEVALAKYFATSPGSGEVRIGKSAGLLYSPTGLQRLHDDSPAVQAVVIVRNPVSRAYSAYLWAVRSGFETDSFDAAVDRELAGRDLDLDRPWLRRYLTNGEYAGHLDTAREVFGADAVTVLTMDEFAADPVGTVNALLTPFGTAVPTEEPRSTRENTASGIRSARLARVMRSKKLRAPLRAVLPLKAQVALNKKALAMNQREVASERMSETSRAKLAEHFAPWNRRLEQQLGRELGWD